MKKTEPLLTRHCWCVKSVKPLQKAEKDYNPNRHAAASCSFAPAELLD